MLHFKHFTSWVPYCRLDVIPACMLHTIIRSTAYSKHLHCIVANLQQGFVTFMLQTIIPFTRSKYLNALEIIHVPKQNKTVTVSFTMSWLTPLKATIFILRFIKAANFQHGLICYVHAAEHAFSQSGVRRHPIQRCQPLTKEKHISEDEKKYFGLKNSIFNFVSIEVYVHKVILEKKYFEAFFAQNHKYLQLEKSTKYCRKKEQLASLPIADFGHPDIHIFCVNNAMGWKEIEHPNLYFLFGHVQFWNLG